MKKIIAAYRSAEAQIKELLGDRRHCPDKDKCGQIREIVTVWQRGVVAQLDELTALRFEGVRASAAWPIQWDSISEDGMAAYAAYLTMGKQIQWLAERFESGAATIKVEGSNNQIVVGQGNTVKGS